MLARRAIGFFLLWATPLFAGAVWWPIPSFTWPSFAADAVMNIMLFGGGWLLYAVKVE